MKISFRAESRLGYCLRFLVNLRMVLFTDSIVFVVSVALRISVYNKTQAGRTSR